MHGCRNSRTHLLTFPLCLLNFDVQRHVIVQPPSIVFRYCISWPVQPGLELRTNPRDVTTSLHKLVNAPAIARVSPDPTSTPSKTMFRRPAIDSPRIRATPIDITSSPPSPPQSTKRQKTSHASVAKKQTQTPGKKGVKGKKMKEEAGNKSIMSFFKPVNQSPGSGEGVKGLKDGNGN